MPLLRGGGSDQEALVQDARRNSQRRWMLHPPTRCGAPVDARQDENRRLPGGEKDDRDPDGLKVRRAMGYADIRIHLLGVAGCEYNACLRENEGREHAGDPGRHHRADWRACSMSRWFSARSPLSLPAQELERAARLSACAYSPCSSRTRASSCHRRGLRGSMRRARSSEAAALASRPAAVSERALSMRPAIATLSRLCCASGSGSVGGAVSGAV